MIANYHRGDATSAWHNVITCVMLFAGLTGCAPSGQTSTESQSAASSLQSASAASSSSEVVVTSAVVATSSVATSAESSSASSAEKTVTAPASPAMTKTSGNARGATSSSSQAANTEAHEVASTHETQAETAPPASATASPSATDSSLSSSSTTLSAAPASQPSLDLDSLEQRLRDTKAIGLFTKLSLKNQVDDLLNAFRAHYSGKSNIPLSNLRQRYDLLLMKILTLLQDSDTSLAADVRSSREAIWDILKDPKKFAKIS